MEAIAMARECFRQHPAWARFLLRRSIGGRPLASLLAPFQQSAFEAIDDVLIGVRDGTPAKVRRVWWERARGHSKTEDAAVCLVWLLAVCEETRSLLVVAADREQGTLLLAAIDRLCRANPALLGRLVVGRSRVRNPQTGTELTVVSSDVGSSFGMLPDFVVADEIVHWRAEALWHSVLSSTAKRPHCGLLVCTNAGYIGSWQWELREAVRKRTDWFICRTEGRRAPWILEEDYEQQAALLPRDVYRRLWLNEWVGAVGVLLDRAEINECVVPQTPRTYAARVVAVDFGERRDRCVVGVAHQELDGLVVLDEMHVWDPAVQGPTPVAWVEETLAVIFSRSFVQAVYVDEYQLLDLTQRRSEWGMRRLAFRGGKTNQLLTQALVEAIRAGRVAWERECGAVATLDGGVSSLADELAALIVTQTRQGGYRMDHLPQPGYHDDRAFVLGVLLLHFATEGHGVPFLVVTPPAGSSCAWGQDCFR